MPPGISLQSDFTAGELSPDLGARVDLAKYQKGCRTLRNFLVQAHGPAVKRPGFELLGALPGPARLVGFSFNTEQTYTLAFGEKWMRVATHDGFILTDAGEIYEIETPYTLEQARRLSWTQSADVLFLAAWGAAPQRLKRLAHDHWEFEPINFGAPIEAPAWNADIEIYEPVYSKLYNSGTAYTRGGSPPDYAYSPINRDLYGLVSVAAGFGAVFVNQAKKSDGTTSPAQLVTPYNYYVTAVNADGKESELSEPANITGPSSNNWQAGDYLALSWNAVEGAGEYRVYKAAFGGRPGYIATVSGLEFKDYNVTPSVSEGAPKYVNPFALEDGEGGIIEDYPGVVCLFEQRLVFASTPRRPQTIWMSKSGDYLNFASYSPIADDSPLELTIASEEVSLANWMLPLRSLILGTVGVEWEIAGASGNAFTAKTAKATPQSYWGSSLTRALIVGNVILHVSRSGRQVRNLQYDFGTDSYGGTDLSIMAAHLLDKHKITDWTYQKSPDSIVWAVRSDGVLLGLTFQAEHQIAAWHRHDTQGKFISACSVPREDEYSLFAVIERGGAHYLERMASRFLGGDARHAVFMDSALTYEGEEALQTFSGLEHLEGKEVGIFSEGAVEAPRRVQDGKITLDRPSRLVTVGLLYSADLETMPVEVLGQAGASVGLKKQISTINISFSESTGAKAGISKTPGDLTGVKWENVNWRGSEPYGAAPAPFTGVKHLVMPVLAENLLSICIRSELPTPVTVQSIMNRVQVLG